jgi:hypothetical protein
MKCFHSIGRKRRKQIRIAFQKMDRSQQKLYLLGVIDLHPVKYKGLALQIRPRKQRAFSAEYHLKASSDKRQRVCLKAFTAILSIGSKQVKLLNTYAWTHGAMVPPDGRGKHKNRPNRIKAVTRVDTHIKSFPRESSHYSLDPAADRFLSADLSVRKMWRLYLVKYEPLTQPPDESGEEDGGKADAAAQVEGAGDERQKPQVTYDYYLSRFHRFDLKFGVPAVDSCSRCTYTYKTPTQARRHTDTETDTHTYLKPTEDQHIPSCAGKNTKGGKEFKSQQLSC